MLGDHAVETDKDLCLLSERQKTSTLSNWRQGNLEQLVYSKNYSPLLVLWENKCCDDSTGVRDEEDNPRLKGELLARSQRDKHRITE